MPPQPINLVVNTSNVNTNMNGGYGVVVKKRGTPILLCLIYFCLIGWWVGFYWVIVALILTAFGKEAGHKMMNQLSMVFFLRQSS